METYQQKGLLIDKQRSPDLNRFFTMTQDTELLCAESTRHSCTRNYLDYLMLSCLLYTPHNLLSRVSPKHYI